MSSGEDLLDCLRRDGCYLEKGHFMLVSGKHSDSYIQVRIGMMHPRTCQAFAIALTDRLSKFEPTALAASTVGGILLAIETASRLGIPTLIGRQVAMSVTWVNEKKLKPEALAHIVLVDDLITTGGSVQSEIQSLRQIGAKIAVVAVAVDRTEGGTEKLLVDGTEYKIVALCRVPLNLWDPSNCPICPKPIINLHNPEQNFLSVILSMSPSQKAKMRAHAKMAIDGYRKVYELQGDKEQLDTIKKWKPWLPSLLADLPVVRVGEDSDLAQFIRFVHREESHRRRRRVLTEFVGHLLAISNIRVESRSLGCCNLVGDDRKLLNILEMKIPIKVPQGIRSDNLNELVPYYDALQETEAVFLFDRDGELVGIRRLVHPTESGETRGIQLLQQLTSKYDTVGIVLRRDRKAIAVYRKGRLDAVAELSEKNGLWEFSIPTPIDEIAGLIPGIEQTLEMMLEISREMAYRGYGGIFVIGDVPQTLQRKPPKIKMERVPVSSLGIGMASEIAKLDGAMFVTKDGYVEDASVIILNATVRDSDVSTSPKIGGSRKETAYRTSLECPDTAVICVSQNGTIEIFVNGRSWPVSEAITDMSRRLPMGRARK